METYAICGEHVLFARTSDRSDRGSKAITLSRKIVSECADEIARTVPEENPYTFLNMRLCPNCNNYGFPSTYILVEPDQSTDLCTGCANRLRTDGRHIVDEATMEISPSIVTAQPKYSSDEIHQKVIKAEKELKVDEEKRKWYLRACRVNICPKCGASVVINTIDIDIFTEYKCSICSFVILEDEAK
jgi:ribosomal protein L32